MRGRGGGAVGRRRLRGADELAGGACGANSDGCFGVLVEREREESATIYHGVVLIGPMGNRGPETAGRGTRGCGASTRTKSPKVPRAPTSRETHRWRSWSREAKRRLEAWSSDGGGVGARKGRLGGDRSGGEALGGFVVLGLVVRWGRLGGSMPRRRWRGTEDDGGVGGGKQRRRKRR